MTEQTPSYLVLVDDGENFRSALVFAARRAKKARGRVALLYVVESGEIETWGGVERAIADEAFNQARKEMAAYESLAEEISGVAPDIHYTKGDRRAALFELIEREKSVIALVLPALAKDGVRHPLAQEMTSEKNLKKLTVPLIIVPAACRGDDSDI